MKLPGLDGLRALAIGLVFLLHLSTALKRATPAFAHEAGWLARLCSGGGVGVALFFAVSGFLVGLPFAQSKTFSIKDYARRRFFRIVPPYWLVLGAAFVGQVVLGWTSARALLPALLASAFFAHNLSFDTWSRVLPVAWSLEIEVQFYLLAPLLSRLYRLPRAEAWLFGLAALGATLSAALNPWLARWHLDRSVLSEGHFFLFGMALTGRFARCGALAPRSALWDGAGLVGLFAMLLLWGRPGPVAQFIALIGIATLFLSALHGRIGPALARFFAPLGERCYSLYLLHYPLLSALLGPLLRLGAPTTFAAALMLEAALTGGIILVASEIFFRFAERPWQKYGKKQKIFETRTDNRLS